MNVALWILQGVLAAFFLIAGVMKSTMPRERLITSLPWVEDFSTPTVRFIGGAELLGALGLILPAATGIAPILTPIAASTLAVVMVLAGFTHYRRKGAVGDRVQRGGVRRRRRDRVGPIRSLRVLNLPMPHSFTADT